jgi:hypothetical protein
MQAHARRVIAECLEPRTVVALRKEWLQPAPAGIGLFL